VKLGSQYGYPLGTAGRSGWVDVLAQLLGAEGHAVLIKNMAIGGSGLLSGWNGNVRTWIASTNGFAPGSWCLPVTPNGFKYRAEGTPGISQSTGATQPAWPTTVNATVVDGTVTWTCKAADAKDVNGYICQDGDSGYDPRGYIAALLAAIADAKARGFEVWVLSSGHQSDYGNPAVTISGVLVSLMRKVLAAGPDRVYLGVTNRFVGDASATQWDAGGFYPTVRNLALAALSDDPRVMAGADLSAIADAVMTDPAGRIHLNDVGVMHAGSLWRQAIAA
jgi:hypothetical protein